MTLFTVGPVQMHASTLKIAGNQLPYFRDVDFSRVNQNIAQNIKSLLNAPESAGTVLLTASGTGAMEATVMNLFNESDNLLVINGGSFGNRFCEICAMHSIPYTSIQLQFGEVLTESHLTQHAGKNFTGLLVNIHETSTGQLYDIEMLADFCRRNHLLFVVDAISSFLADAFDFSKCNVDGVIISSQKALALSPGLSVVVLSERALRRVEKQERHSIYFDFNLYLKDIERGQTPFTPAVGILLEMDGRLCEIMKMGLEVIIKETAQRAFYFRKRIKSFPIQVYGFPLSNALTPILFDGNAKEVYQTLKEKYGLVLTPSGGSLADTVLRVGHLGALTHTDYDKLSEALAEICEVKQLCLL